MHASIKDSEPGFGHTIDNFDIVRCKNTTHDPDVSLLSYDFVDKELFVGIDFD